MIKILTLAILSAFGVAQIAAVQIQGAGAPVVVTLVDGAVVHTPQDLGNADWRAVVAWRAQGSSFTAPAVPPVYYDPLEAVMIRMQLAAIATELTSTTTGVTQLQALRNADLARLVILHARPLAPGTSPTTPTAP